MDRRSDFPQTRRTSVSIHRTAICTLTLTNFDTNMFRVASQVEASRS